MTTLRGPPAVRRSAPLWLLALGVVFGDIGTSPLYALRACIAWGVEPTPENVLGLISLFVWSLVLVISIKYAAFVLRADLRGEGGILALTMLVAPRREESSRGRRILLTLGLVGTALLYGDGMITPAISVLSAVEGLELASPTLEPVVLPLAAGILVALFWFQRRGTHAVGSAFGPVMLLWFGGLALLGVRWILRAPEILVAASPLHAASFLAREPATGFVALGAVFLVVTGGEALYADLGHFGRGAIRRAWFGLVLPALVLNYAGQGALLLREPAAAANPFFHLAPAWTVPPLVALAAVATVIASQAVISGAFSLTSQAVQLGFCPRVEVLHRSVEERGQVYVPTVNTLLMLAAIALVLGFGSSEALAGAYGIAVAATMVVTTILFYAFLRRRLRWRAAAALALTAAFLTVDLPFLGSNLTKITQGGWFPLAVAALVYLIFSTWSRGRRLLARRLRDAEVPMATFARDVETHPPRRTPGTSIFLTSRPGWLPRTLTQNAMHNKVLHERVVILSVAIEEVPRVPTRERLHVRRWSEGLLEVTAHYGFMQVPHVPVILKELEAIEEGFPYEPEQTTFFVGTEAVLVGPRPGLGAWRTRLFAFLSRNAQRATGRFRLPPDRVVELGMEIEL